MEKPTDKLVFKGSILDAITEARKHKKLFVVYISGEDENSLLLEQSTWVDQNVHEVIMRCCVFLHLIQGSVDASQFSAIYPLNTIPSISAIGLNGVLLWHHEGYFDAESLKENIEKSLAALHLQETAATLLTAALTTQNPSPVTGTSAANPSTQGGPTTSDVPSTSSDADKRSSECAPLSSSDKKVDSRNSESSHDKEVGPTEEECQKDEVTVVSTSEAATANKAVPHEERKKKGDSSATPSSIAESKSEEITKTDVLLSNIEEAGKENNSTSIAKSNDVHLNIRMPNGTNLQIKLVKSDALRSVKNFVDEQQDVQAGSYDLAIPYPRKLFNEEDMVRTLSELGFANRETLIVVPHRSTRSLRPQTVYNNNSINTSQDISSENGGGYFSYLRRLLSYVNPLSYFGGNSSLANPNPSANNQDHLAREGASQASQNSVNAGQRTASRSFGSNIHTLRHDDRTDPSRDRNTFWNGNSTQFGGSDQ